ncbi:MAG: type II toxin-antitoxin system PemK/MazF family toxin [Anaerolineae bacterium]
MAEYIPSRGDLVWITTGQRPEYHKAERCTALVLSPAAYNEKTGRAILCLIVNPAKGNPFEVALPEGIPVRGVVLADQVLSLDWREQNAILVRALPEDMVDNVLHKLATLLTA